MPGKELTFENGDVVDVQEHTIIDRPGANPFCRRCGEINPDPDERCPA